MKDRRDEMRETWVGEEIHAEKNYEINERWEDGYMMHYIYRCR